MNKIITYQLSEKDAKDLLSYLIDVENMYRNIEEHESEAISSLREKLKVQYVKQTN